MPSDFQKFMKKIHFYFLCLKVEESERERGKERKEKDEKLAKLAKLDKLERVKRADALRPLSLFSYPTSFLGSCTRSDCYIFISVIIFIL